MELNLEIEAGTRVNLAAVLDDGEAVTGAIAVHRNWAIATDDKAAIRVFNQMAPQLQIITTPELIKYWAEKCQPSAQTIHNCLQNIEVGARYRPGRQHPLYTWWQDSSIVE